MNPRRRDLLALTGALLAGSVPSGCLEPAKNGIDPSGDPPLVAATRPRADPTVPPTDLESLVTGNTAFALALHQQLAKTSPRRNLFLSPFSISIALAMTYAGARGETATEMAQALLFHLDQARLHPAFNSLDRRLTALDEAGSTPNTTTDESDEEGQPFELRITNSIWGQANYPFREPYLDTLAVNYGAGLRTLDFTADPEAARGRINDWVAAQTNDRITDLLPEGVITALTRLVLTNAIYFTANWMHTFPAEMTTDAAFTTLDGSTVTVPLMRQSERFPYARVDGHQLIELPYVGGDVGMVVVLPADGAFETVERDLDVDRLTALTDALEPREGTIALPRFGYDTAFRLRDALSLLGMPSAFDPDEADFGDMADLEQTGTNLHLQDVVHKSFVAVDEDGTEAAATTGVVVGETSAPLNPFEMTVDRPFLFLIRDRETGTVLFLGRVVDASASQ